MGAGVGATVEVGVGLSVGLGVGVGVCVTLGVIVSVGVMLGVGLDVAVGVGVTAGVGLGVTVGAMLGAGVGAGPVKLMSSKYTVAEPEGSVWRTIALTLAALAFAGAVAMRVSDWYSGLFVVSRVESKRPISSVSSHQDI